MLYVLKYVESKLGAVSNFFLSLRRMKGQLQASKKKSLCRAPAGLHICEFHHNLLRTQQPVLLSDSEDADGKLGKGLSENKQFNSMTIVHNETLASVTTRPSQIRERLEAWDHYRQDQAQLLSWLRDTERERGQLQLWHIHTTQVPKMLRRIKSLLDKVPSGESRAEHLREQQSKVFHFCDDAVATSIRMEHAAITQRISNLQAGLETWQDILKRFLLLSTTFEDQVNQISSVYREIHTAVTEPDVLPLSHTGMQNRLENLRLLRSHSVKLMRDLVQLRETREQLKEYVSPEDMKTVNQKLRLLWQGQRDLDRHIAVLCRQLEGKLGLRMMFCCRCYRRLNFQQYFGTLPSAKKAILHRDVTAAVAKTKDLRAYLLLQYTDEYKQYSEEQKEGGSKQPVKAPEKREKTAPRTSGLSSSTHPSVHPRNSLMNVMVPSALTGAFMYHAQFNTMRNIETCAVLAGRNFENQLRVTHLLIPKQHGTDATEELGTIIVENELIQLGWIHTHPRHGMFLSSVDMHTQCSFQQLQAESLAIVCIPRHHQIGFYHLTPQGLDFVRECQGIGFHDHPDSPALCKIHNALMSLPMVNVQLEIRVGNGWWKHKGMYGKVNSRGKIVELCAGREYTLSVELKEACGRGLWTIFWDLNRNYKP